MRFSFYLVVSVVFLFSCGKDTSIVHMDDLNGYWAIEKVKLANGSEKEFSISTTVDFIEVTGTTGIRKKVQPKLDGTFITSNDTETFQLKTENDSLKMYYKTPYDAWKETVIKVKDSSLVVVNRNGNTYFYKRFKQFDFN